MLQNKKALNELIGYVLLIVIAIGVSVAVFGFLKLYVPKEKIECSQDISLILKDYSCDATAETLQVTLVNRGLFSVSAIYIRVAEEGKRIRHIVNQNNLFFNDGLQPLAPGESHTQLFNTDRIVSGKNTLEIQPADLTESGELALCESSVITQTITCN